MSTIKCPRCERKLNYPDELAGKFGKCSNCGERVHLSPPAAGVATPPIQSSSPPAITTQQRRRWPLILLAVWAISMTVASAAFFQRWRSAANSRDNQIELRADDVERYGDQIRELMHKAFVAKGERDDARARWNSFQSQWIDDQARATEVFNGELVKFGLEAHRNTIIDTIGKCPGPIGDNAVVFLAVVQSSHGMSIDRQLAISQTCIERRALLGSERDRLEFAGLAGWRAAIDPGQEPPAVFASTLEMWQKFYQGRNRPPGQGCLRGIEVFVHDGTKLEDAIRMSYNVIANGLDPDDLYGWSQEKNWRGRRRPWETPTIEQPAVHQPAHEESTPNESDPPG